MFHGKVSADIDEKAIRHEDPKELVMALAHAKADAILGDPVKRAAMLAGPAGVYLVTCDQVVVPLLCRVSSTARRAPQASVSGSVVSMKVASSTRGSPVASLVSPEVSVPVGPSVLASVVVDVTDDVPEALVEDADVDSDALALPSVGGWAPVSPGSLALSLSESSPHAVALRTRVVADATRRSLGAGVTPRA